MHAYNGLADRVGEQAGEFHAQYMTIGPAWAKQVDAATVNTLVEGGFGILAIGPNLVLFPEAVWNAPDQIATGAGRVHEGITTGHYDLAAKGAAEVCGGIGVLASAAVPFLRAGRPPTTLFGKQGPPVLRPPVVAPPASPSGAAAAPRSIMIRPTEIRWSQTTAGGNGRTAIYRARIQKGKSYTEGPIDMVETPEGPVTLDNTRAAVALEAQIPKIPARLHQWNEPLPAEMIADGRFGEAKTWGEALEMRTKKQNPFIPPTGTTKPPKLMGPKQSKPEK